MALPPFTKTDWQCKIVLIGDSNVGKTCLMRRYTESAFSESFISTIGIDFKLKVVKVKGHVIKVQIWDTAGQEKFRSITTAYYRGAKGIFIVYDVSDKKSFDHISAWVTNVNRWANDNTEIMLLGNKCDLEDRRQVLKKDGERISREKTLTFLETSAKNDINIEEAFSTMLERIVDRNIDKIRERMEVRAMEEVKIDPERYYEAEPKKRICCK